MGPLNILKKVSLGWQRIILKCVYEASFCGIYLFLYYFFTSLNDLISTEVNVLIIS